MVNKGNKTSDHALSIICFACLDYTFVTGLNLTHCVWRKEDKSNTFKILNMGVGSAIIDKQNNFPLPPTQLSIPFSQPCFKDDRGHPSILIGLVTCW